MSSLPFLLRVRVPSASLTDVWLPRGCGSSDGTGLFQRIACPCDKRGSSTEQVLTLCLQTEGGECPC